MSYVPPKNEGAETKPEHSVPDGLPFVTSAQEKESHDLKVNTKDAKPKGKWSELDLQDRLIVVLTAGIFLVAVVTACIFLRQADVMEGQLEEMKGGGNQTERLIILNQGQLMQTSKEIERMGQQVVELKRSADETHNLVFQTKKSIVILDSNAVKDRRPYIWAFTPAFPTMKVGQPAKWSFNYINYGKSPAIGVALRRQIIVSGYGDESREHADLFTRLHSKGQEEIGIIIPPGDASNFSTAESDTIVGDSDIKYSEKQDGGMVLLIYFEYSDTAGNMYSSEVCQFTKRNGLIGICDRHSRIK